MEWIGIYRVDIDAKPVGKHYFQKHTPQEVSEAGHSPRIVEPGLTFDLRKQLLRFAYRAA